MLTTEAPGLRKRLRPAWSPERLAQLYAQPHDHRLWGRGHGERVVQMIELARSFRCDKLAAIMHSMVSTTTEDVDENLLRSVADLSCGNGEVVRGIGGFDAVQLGDFAPGYQFHGPIEQTIEQIDDVDLFVLGETLEHLDDPLMVLQRIRERTDFLLLSTPIDCWEDSNDDHYWAWSREGVEDLAEAGAGFTGIRFTDVDSRTYGEPYRYGIWMFG